MNFGDIIEKQKQKKKTLTIFRGQIKWHLALIDTVFWSRSTWTVYMQNSFLLDINPDVHFGINKTLAIT